MIDSKKVPRYGIITGKVLEKLPDNGILFLTQVFTAIIRTSHYPSQRKVSKIPPILKHEKVPEDVVKFYRPISHYQLSPRFSKSHRINSDSESDSNIQVQ